MDRLQARARDLYGRHVIENPAVQNTLLKAMRFGLRQQAWVRGGLAVALGRRRPMTNVYYASVQKTGSHWFKAVFDDPRVRRHSGLWTFPGHRYEWDEFRRRFPPRHFVPGLFLSYPQYEEIRKPARYRTFYVIRDPRDIVVSWYHSMVETHRLAGRVVKDRRALRACSFEEGIAYSIRELAYKFAFMRTWMYNAADPNVLIVRFEEITRDPFTGWRAIFDHCEIPIPDDELAEVLADYTKEKMRARDEARSFLRQRTLSAASHYRPQASTWQEAFTDAHVELFEQANGDLLNLLGYAPFEPRPAATAAPAGVSRAR